MGSKFLGIPIRENLTWTLSTNFIYKKSKKHLHLLRRQNRPSPCSTEGLQEASWFGNCTASHCKPPLEMARTVRVSLPSVMDIWTTNYIHKATSIVDDLTQPSHTLFSLLLPGKRFCSLQAFPASMGNSFFPQAIRLLNQNWASHTQTHSWSALSSKHTCALKLFPINKSYLNCHPL